MFAFGECELDPARFELRRAGEPVHVEPQVFEVLRYLVAHHDRVVPRTELMDAVWGSRFVADATLASRVKAARQALGDDGQAQQYIATVHGVGYHFVAPVAERNGAPDPFPARRQEIRYCRTPDGVRLAYAVSGHGPPLVKAANWLTHLDYEWDSPIWSHWIDGLSRGHRLLRYDERGCGLSDHDVADFGLEAWVEDLETVVGAASPGTFDLIGISQGAAVAIAYAVRHPELVRRLILVGGYSRGRLARATTPEAREEAAVDLALAKLAWRRDDESYRQVFAAQFLPDAPRARWRDFNELQRATTSTENVVRFLDSFARLDVSGIADQVSCPTLILHSRLDQRVPQAQARELAALIPHSTLRFLDSGNHILMEDEPAWSELLAEIEAFTQGA